MGEMNPVKLQFIRELAENARLQVEAHDPYTKEHSVRVAQWSKIIANRIPTISNDRERLTRLEIAAIVHDYGKIDVPPQILNKVEPLTEEEFEKIKVHPVTGAKRVEMFRDYVNLEAILYHHVRYGGGGYPATRLSRQEIPLEARIIAVADTFDAIASKRSYRAARPPLQAMAELKRAGGTQLDPTVARIFENYYREQQQRHSGAAPGAMTMAVDAVIGEEIRAVRHFLQKKLGTYDPRQPLAKVPAAGQPALLAEAVEHLAGLSVTRENAEKFVRYACRIPQPDTFARADVELSDAEFEKLVGQARQSLIGHVEVTIPLKKDLPRMDYLDLVVFGGELWNYIGDGRKVVLMR